MSTTVEAVFVTATETLAEVVLILRQVCVVTVVSVRSILIGPRILEAESPSVLAVGLPGSHTFFIAKVQRTSQLVRTILIDRVVPAAAEIPPAIRRVDELSLALKSESILTQSLPIQLLESVLIVTSLLLE